MTGAAEVPYQYLVLRCVPRVDREEFLNVGVVLYSQRASFLACASRLDDARLRSLATDLDLDAVAQALAAVAAVCRGDESAGLAGASDLGRRFGYLSAPRSTVVQPGPVHGGVLTAVPPDPQAVLDHLLGQLVLTPSASGDQIADQRSRR
ncbi:MAG: DUF3037 domain-containing protein [Nocardioidaceae bacterium]